MRFVLLLVAAVSLVGCGGNGGGSSSVGGSSDGLPSSCVQVGSISNTGGPITVIANCTNGTGNVVQTCFSQGASGTEQPVPVPCDNGGSGQVVGGPTPIP